MDHSDDLPAADILRFTLDDVPMATSDAIAFATIRVGDLTFHGVSLRRPHDLRRDAFVVMPGRRLAGISVAMDSPIRTAIEAAMFDRYRDETGLNP